MNMHVCMECVGAPPTLHVGVDAMHVTWTLHSFTYLQLCMNEHVHDMNHNEKSIETRERLEPIIGDSLFIQTYMHSCFILAYMHAFLLPTSISHSCHVMLWL